MSISRREFGLVVASGLFVLLTGKAEALQSLPLSLTFDGVNAAHRKAHGDSGKRHKGPSNATSITDVWQPIKLAAWVQLQGAAAIEVDHNGGWTFSGRFYDSSPQSDRISLVMGITNDSATGKLFLFETTGVMTATQGGQRQFTWYKQGRSYDVQGDWKNLQKGHFWAGHYAYRGPQATGPTVSGFGLSLPGLGPPPAPGEIDFDGLENAVETKLNSVGKVIRLCR